MGNKQRGSRWAIAVSLHTQSSRKGKVVVGGVSACCMNISLQPFHPESWAVRRLLLPLAVQQQQQQQQMQLDDPVWSHLVLTNFP